MRLIHYAIILKLLLVASVASQASSPTLNTAINLLQLSKAQSSTPDYTWLRLFGMWHDQLTPTGYALGAGAKIDPSPKTTLAIDAEIRLQRENLSADAETVGNALGLVVPVTLQYTLLGNHSSFFQPFLLGGGYYTASEMGGNEFGWLAGAGLALRLGTEVIAIDTRYYSDTYVTDVPDTHHYAARLTLWFHPSTSKSTPTRGTSRTRKTGGSKDPSTGKNTY